MAGKVTKKSGKLNTLQTITSPMAFHPFLHFLVLNFFALDNVTAVANFCFLFCGFQSDSFTQLQASMKIL